jgi:hypothetical protein
LMALWLKSRLTRRLHCGMLSSTLSCQCTQRHTAPEA